MVFHKLCFGLEAELPDTFGHCSFPGLLMLLAALWLYFFFHGFGKTELEFVYKGRGREAV